MRTRAIDSRRPHQWSSLRPLQRIGWIGVALALAGAALLAGADAADAQSLDRLARDAEVVTLAYPAAANVCGAGDGILIREPDGATMFVSGRVSHTDWRRWTEGDPPCEAGDVTVRMRRADRGWADVRLAVGRAGKVGAGGEDARRADQEERGQRGAERARDLGYVAGQAAAEFLLDAARASGSRAGRDLILAAAIAGDAEIWPRLLTMARDRALPTRTRRTAIHWLGRRAAREAVDELGGIVRDRTEDDEIREAAVFAISQLPDDRAVPMLIDIVRTMDDARVVNRALFWLADLEDPRVVALFEEILRGPGR